MDKETQEGMQNLDRTVRLDNLIDSTVKNENLSEKHQKVKINNNKK